MVIIDRSYSVLLEHKILSRLDEVTVRESRLNPDIPVVGVGPRANDLVLDNGWAADQY